MTSATRGIGDRPASECCTTPEFLFLLIAAPRRDLLAAQFCRRRFCKRAFGTLPREKANEVFISPCS